MISKIIAFFNALPSLIELLREIYRDNKKARQQQSLHEKNQADAEAIREIPKDATAEERDKIINDVFANRHRK